ncbi:MAG: hypothetical protein ABUL64_00360 [Singulisphaera sp.]
MCGKFFQDCVWARGGEYGFLPADERTLLELRLAIRAGAEIVILELLAFGIRVVVQELALYRPTVIAFISEKYMDDDMYQGLFDQRLMLVCDTSPRFPP